MAEKLEAKDPRVVQVANAIGIKPKMIVSFMNGFDVDNHRYELVYMWILQRVISKKQFKRLLPNIRIRNIEDFTYRGNYIFRDKTLGNGALPEDYMIGG